MKIAILGTTLQAGVLAALLAEYGNQVYWCYQHSHLSTTSINIQYQDEEVNRRLSKQREAKMLLQSTLVDLPLDIDTYLFCYNPAEFKLALNTLKELALRPIIHPKLMVNGSTFGLHGTDKLKAILPNDDWVYFPDVIQEGNAINSVLNVKHVIIGAEAEAAKLMMEELLRPFFRYQNQYLFMPILDAEFTKLSISGMLATRISYMNDLALVAEKLGIDIANVRQGMGADTRIGSAYLSAGAGFGGRISRMIF